MKRIEGVWTALITPFTAKNQLDEEGLRQNLHLQKEGGVDGVVALGTTGEAPTLSREEKKRVIAICKEFELPLMVGTGTYSTEETIHATKDCDADAALIITPYYNKPTQKGIYQHFEAICEAVDIPIVVYNHRGRTGQNIETETLQDIAKLPNIVGVKEVSGSIQQAGEIVSKISMHHPNFTVLSGDDPLTLPMMALGGHGVISVAANIVPAKIVALVKAMQQDDLRQARLLHIELQPLFHALFVETNPIPIKAIMKHAGLPAGDCRLPLSPLESEHLPTIQALALQYGHKEPLHSST